MGRTIFSGMRGFVVIWTGEFASLLGSGITGFALGVWVYERTGSATLFAVISLITTLPGIVVLPLAGALVDRWDRRQVLILYNAGAGAATFALAALLLAGRLEVWHIYIAVGVISTLGAFQWPAFAASTTLLVPKRHLVRANGMLQTAESATHIACPMLAGILVVGIGTQGVLLIDSATFLFALATLLSVHIPRPQAAPSAGKEKSSLLSQITYGWHYIASRRGFLALLVFVAATNFAISIMQVLIPVLILSFASPAVLGTVLSVGGGGMLLGSLCVSTWGGPQRRIYGVLGFGMLQGAVLLLGGFEVSAQVAAGMLFVVFFSVPIMAGCSQAIWQSKVAPGVQGRVFALRRMVGRSSTPLAFILAGPLADYVFEPLLTPGGPLAGTVGRLIGVGAGRGIGLLFVVLGSLLLLAGIISWLYTPLRTIELQLPDFEEPETPGAAVSASL